MFDSAGMDSVAEVLGLHPRTLRRRLADEGTTFEALLDEVRFAFACELLDLTDISNGEIAGTLSFASPGVFSESFHRVAHASPKDW
jgi:AraC-like DNA-binding protein